MSRYAIWNKSDDIYTPVGEKLTAEQWLSRYAWAGIPGVKMVIGGGAINGTVAMEFEAMKAQYAGLGADYTGCTTDDEVLSVIEAFEDAPPEPVAPSTEERTAAALEAIAAGQTTEAIAALDALLGEGEEAE